MYNIVVPRFSLRLIQKVKNNIGKRFFLSEAYKCTDVWENRLKNEVFKKIDTENLYHHLDLNFQAKTRVSTLDIDLFLNNVKDYAFKNEVEDILVKLRLCPECRILPERATHAAIRWYADNAPKEDLLNALGDRLNFGLFPDYYLSNLLMNDYILKNDSVSAVKIAVLQMLQEDFENPLTKALALYSCFFYLDSSDVWSSSQPTGSEDEDESDIVKKVRIPYIRNPYYDDHFDITNSNHLVGKTLWMLGKSINGSLGTACELIGLVLYEKYKETYLTIKKLIENKSEVNSEALERIKSYLDKTPKLCEKEGGEVDAKDSDGYKKQILELLDQFKEKSLVKADLLTEVKKLVEQTVKENEAKEIQFQTQLYKQWEEERKKDIENEISRKKLEELESEIQKTKEELEEEEEKLFFFERQDEIQLLVEEKEEEKKSVVYYKSPSRTKVKTVDDYIPPDVSQRKN